MPTLFCKHIGKPTRAHAKPRLAKFTSGIAERGSFPARVLAKVNTETNEQLARRSERIDYILVSPELAKNCVNAEVYNGQANWYLLL